MNAGEFNAQLIRCADRLSASLIELDKCARDFAEAEAEYKLQRSTAYLATSGTVAEREARAEQSINKFRLARDMAEGLKLSALEAVRANRAILSAMQTVTNLYREEAAFDRTGPA